MNPSGEVLQASLAEHVGVLRQLVEKVKGLNAEAHAKISAEIDEAETHIANRVDAMKDEAGNISEEGQQFLSTVVKRLYDGLSNVIRTLV